MRSSNTDELRSILREGQPRPIILLGAGASVMSGVPLVKDLIEMIGRQGYCWANGRDFKDPTLVRSDWLPWVQARSWYEADLDPAEMYGLHIEELLNPRERRRRFFQEHVLVSPQKASVGYRRLASLVGKRRVHSVITTNFDTLAFDLCRQDPTASAVVQIQSPDQADLISTDPAVSQIIHAHGVVDHYTDQNLKTEVASLDARFAEKLIPLISDHPLIVIGYRGAEPSIARDLLMAAAKSHRVPLPHGVYWCERGKDGARHPNVEELAATCGNNFAVVPIEGFDELLSDLDEETLRATGTATETPLTFDSLSSGVACDEANFDLSRLRNVLASDAMRRLALDSDNIRNAADATSRLLQLNLARAEADDVFLTNAGNALFGGGTPLTAVGHVHGNAFQVRGNIFELFEALSELTTESNAPYRLKGPQSVDVRPFPPLAVKELLVNALGHRDLDSREPIQLTITADSLRIINPGGLRDIGVAASLGKVPVKDYRNPHVAEVLYAAGLMDKHGSGLVDVERWVAEGGGAAQFEVGPENESFTATITSRPDSRSGERVVTAAGDYEVYYLNALPVTLPGEVWVGPTSVRHAKEIFDAHPGVSIPPFVLSGSNIVTLSDLSSHQNPLALHCDGSERHDLEGFCSEPSAERKIVELLNRSTQRHFSVDGMNVWAKRRRVWFHAEPDGSERRISYQARMRLAERTVTRPKDVDRKFPYFEHQAMNWSYVRAGGDWYLTIDPTWIFTQDGEHKLVGRRRQGRLATKKMSNERNQSVLNHVFFWAWIICEGESSIRLSDGGGDVLVSRAPLVRHDLRPLDFADDSIDLGEAGTANDRPAERDEEVDSR